MGNERTENKEMDLVLSSEAKPRLKWTAELHRRFVDAVTQLGGSEKATPKSLMRSMSIPGLTLYHLKSHLQKYRLIGKNQRSESCSHNGPEEVDYRDLEIKSDHVNGEGTGRPGTEMDDLHIAQALQVQLEVQKKLHDQLEVQKHLQLRIEAQGKYLESILTRAQDKLLSNYSTSSALRTQVTESLDTRNHSSSTSELTEIQGFSLMSSMQRTVRRGTLTDCSVDSSLTSSESSGKEIEKVRIDLSKDDDEEEEIRNECSKGIPLLSLMETENSSSSRVTGNKKRSNSCSISNDTTSSEQQPLAKKPIIQPAGEMRKYNFGVKELDLNCEYQVDSEF
ncbi:myb family transcription factor PHL8-like isoform X2 [Papaver somniferum]|uniref:myb family transcription factor PHL8-like isoform X2 n=1 Tax=Papaver somniferum TaxID=3469 RepID=UPI000E6FB8A3|nr:myb family transcription factor PHL8-like isoform X2 [Papaver somniferum]